MLREEAGGQPATWAQLALSRARLRNDDFGQRPPVPASRSLLGSSQSKNGISLVSTAKSTVKQRRFVPTPQPYSKLQNEGGTKKEWQHVNNPLAPTQSPALRPLDVPPRLPLPLEALAPRPSSSRSSLGNSLLGRPLLGRNLGLDLAEVAQVVRRVAEEKGVVEAGKVAGGKVGLGERVVVDGCTKVWRTSQRWKRGMGTRERTRQEFESRQAGEAVCGGGSRVRTSRVPSSESSKGVQICETREVSTVHRRERADERTLSWRTKEFEFLEERNEGKRRQRPVSTTKTMKRTHECLKKREKMFKSSGEV